ncbi:MAG: amino acid adenylation domain-containing protein [Clostridia bacterium]|nr:amino acid adenylation domain-containing protein [Clostridia bacterium]
MQTFKKEDVQDIYFLSPMQEGMLFHSLLNTDSEAYFQQLSFDLTGDLDIELFEKSFNYIVQRYDILRTVFVYEKVKRSVQAVLKTRRSSICFEDISHLDTCSKAEFIEEFKRKDREKGFNLSKDMLIRLAVLKTSPQAYSVVLSFHHIVLDGWCIGIVVRELFEAYRSYRDNRPVEFGAVPSYKQFINWLEATDKKSAALYWEKYLEGYAQKAALPRFKKSGESGEYVQDEISFMLEEGLTKGLEGIAKDSFVTLNTVFQAIWGLILQRYNNTRDVVFGAVVSGRPTDISGFEKMVGLFINTIPVRISCDGGESFAQLIKSVQQQTLASEEYSYFPLNEIQAKTELKQDLIENIVAFENYPLDKEVISLTGGKASGLDLSNVQMFEQTTYDLNVQVIPGSELMVKIKFNSSVYERETIEAVEGHFRKIARTIIANPAAAIKDIEILQEEDKRKLLVEFNDTAADYPRDMTIHGIFEQQVRKTPDNIAVVFEDTYLTYMELNDKANSLALILREKGVKADSIVAIMVERSVEMILGIIAILKAGGAYLPVDPTYPTDRIKYMIEDSGTGILLTQTELKGRVEFNEIMIDLKDESLYSGVCSKIEHINKPSDMAYIIYTSGTTGKPKGVMIEHGNVVRLMFNDRIQFDFNDNDVWTLFHSMCFDFSVWEMYGALLYGGKLVVVSKLTARDTGEYLKLLKKEKVTVLNQTPTAFYNLIDEELKCSDKELSVRYVVFGGEALKPVKLKAWRQKYPAVKLINMYGITETTVHVTYKEITEHEITFNISNIGKPIPTLTTYIVDSDMNLLPIGAAGEMCVGGDGVARGYLNRPELTAEKFVQNPFINGKWKIDNGELEESNCQLSSVTCQLLYRSGDLARMLPNGEMEYLGRIDHQVKIRGHRIELGEIETRILKHVSIKEAVVIAREDKDGNKYLCAYIVSEVSMTVSQLREYLSKDLPEYMIPSYFIQLDKIPMTSNGKVDRKALPIPDGSINTGTEYKAPGNELEEKFAKIWAEVLGVEKLGVNENFFDLGGDSIKAISLISRMNKALNSNIQMKHIYTSPTIEQIAALMDTAAQPEVEYDLKQGLKLIEDVKQGILKDEKQAVLLPEGYEDFYPLSQIQQGMIFYSKLKPEEPIYHDQFVYNIKFKKFDLKVYLETLDLLTQRHPIMRTVFNSECFSRDIQIVHKRLLPEVVLEDISCMSYEDRGMYIKNYLQKDLKNKFKFDNDLMWRMRVFKHDTESYSIVLCCQHAILDGWSVATFISELLEIYNTLIEGGKYEVTKLKSSYKDYVAINLSRRIAPKSQEFWKDTLKGFTRNKLPFNISSKKIDDVRGSKIFRRNLSKELLHSLEQQGKKYGCTLKELCLSAYIYLLGIITIENDIVTGVVTHDRPVIEDGERILGCFLNTVPMRVRLGETIHKLELLKGVKDFLVKSKSNELFLADIAAIVGEVNTGTGNPIFDTLFNFIDFHVLKNAQIKNAISSADESLQMDSNEMTNTLFDLEVSRTLDNFGLQIKYSPNYFYDNDIETAFNLYGRILEKFADDRCEVFEVETLITDEEKQSILYDFNNTDVEYAYHKTMHQLFEEQAERTPDNVALVFEGKKLLYRELNERANQLARLLIDKGVKCGDNVALIADRSFEMIIGMLGILKAGGAYVPVDPAYPAARREYIANNSNVSAVVVDKEYDIDFENVVKIDYSVMDGYSVENTGLHKDSTDLAYIIYTSGSTGLPKGVMIEHHSAVNLISWVNKEFNVGEKDTLLFITSMCFDLSVYDIFGMLASGGRIVIARKEQVQDPDELKKLLKDERITFWDSVPSTMNYIVNTLEDSREAYIQEDLRLAFMSGDWIPVKLPDRIKKYFPNCRVISLGGATEGTVWSIYYPIEKVTEYQTSIPYGRPMDNNYFYILDDNKSIAPYGVAGELYIGGVGVARGYANDPQKTEASFVKDRFARRNNAMMYKTGDLGRMLPDGNIEFLGRKDHQVKIRGYRVELGEIENQLLKHPSIKETVVIDRADSSGNKYLCAYMVSDRELTPTELRDHLSKELPDYMIPSYFIRLDKLPLTPNGKMDRKALPEPSESVNTGTEYVMPANSTEEKLQKVWQEILEIERIGVTDNFFELGGHSLKATSMASRIHRELDVEIPLREVFRLTTIRELAEYIDEANKNIYSLMERVAERDYYPVSSAQKRMFLLNRIDSTGTSYNLPNVMTVEGMLSKERFEKVFKALISRHEALRTSFEIVEGEPVQRIHKCVDFEVEYDELCSGEREAIKEFIRPFDLSKAPSMRIKLVKLAQDRHLMLFDIHHIVSDGMSAGILVKEFTELYNDRELPALRIQYRDFAVWQNNILKSNAIEQQEQYWLDVFKEEVPVLNMPTDYPRPSVQNFDGDRIRFEINKDLTEGLHNICSKTGATMYMVLLAAYNVLLYKYTGQEDIVVGSPIAGRNNTELDNLVGMFVNTLAMRNCPQGTKAFYEFLENVKENSLKAYENQDYQFEELVDKLDLARDLSRNPLFDTMFVLQNAYAQPIEVEGLKLLPYEFENPTAQFDLKLSAVEKDGTVECELEFCTKLFAAETMERLAGHLVNIVRAVVDNPAIRLYEIDMLSKQEKRHILVDFNNTEAVYPKHKTIHGMFEEQVCKVPDNTAVIFGESSLTYSELNEKSNQLARVLREKGVGAESIVGIMLERSAEMMIGIMAILKAGGAYLPISPSYPADRIQYMLEDSGTAVLLVQNRLQDKVEFAGHVIDLNDTSLYRGEGSNLGPIAGPNNLAYVIYTSGSTGKPKGAMIEHYSVINRINWMHKSYPIGYEDVILQKTPFTFDVSVWELFWWSFIGAKVCFLEPGGEKEPAKIVEAIYKHKVTTMHFVPSMLSVFLEYVEGLDDYDKLASLRQVFASGEALSLQQVYKFNRLLNKNCGTKLHNLYGPTEATVDVSYFDCSTGEDLRCVPIGKPIDNIKLYIVDKNNKLQPIGVPGELCISGDGVGRGYLNRPELTAEKFVPNPFATGKLQLENGGLDNCQLSTVNCQLMYRTGDLTRWLPDGNIEFLGRIDHQVKIRGFRIELGEIERQLAAYEGIRDCVVVVKERGSDDKYLAAYYVADEEIKVPELMMYLSQSLPDYMVPGVYVHMSQLPLSPNGKVDRKALPEPEFNRSGMELEYAAPSTDIEKVLAGIWQDVLKLELIGVNDNFFELGGNSLKLVTMHMQLEKHYPGRVKVTDLFAYSTVSKLAQFIEKGQGGEQVEVVIKTQEFPSEYFTQVGESSEGSVLKLKLDDAAYQGLMSMCGANDVELHDVLVGAFMYLMSEITEKQGVALQTTTGYGRVVPVEVDFEGVEDLGQLYRLVRDRRMTGVDSHEVQVLDTVIAGKRDSEAAVLVCGDIGVSSSMRTVFDVILRFSEDGGVTFACEYDGARVRRRKVEELLYAYVKLIRIMLEND